MTEEERPVAADEIEHRHFLAVAAVIQIVARAPIEDHANAQQVEQPAELRLDHLVEVVRLTGSMFGPCSSPAYSMTRPRSYGFRGEGGMLGWR